MPNATRTPWLLRPALHFEVAPHAADLEDVAARRRRRAQNQLAAGALSRPLDAQQLADPGGVDEVDAREIDESPNAAVVEQAVELAPETSRNREVDLADDAQNLVALLG